MTHTQRHIPSSTDSPAPASGVRARFGCAARLAIIFILAALAGWATFLGATALSDYPARLRAYQAQVAKIGEAEVRITASDETYHRRTHRPTEGTLTTLALASELGYQPCWICRPQPLKYPARPALARLGGITSFLLAGAILAVCFARLFGEGSGSLSAQPDGAGRPDLPLPSHLSELFDHFDSLCVQVRDLLLSLPEVTAEYDHANQSSAMAFVMLRWAAHWAGREVSAGADLQTLELEAVEDAVQTPPTLSDAEVEAWSDQVKAGWNQQQFEYGQLLWKTISATGRILVDPGMALLTRLQRDALGQAAGDGRIYDEVALEKLAGMLAATTEFFRRQYVADVRTVGKLRL